MDMREEFVVKVARICDASTRSEAMRYLVRHKDACSNLAELLAETPGAIEAIFKELAAVYPQLERHTLTADITAPACNAFSLLQVIAGDKFTRPFFKKHDYSVFLLPFLYHVDSSWSAENLRLGALGVLGALLKDDDNDDVVAHLVGTPIIPLCLQIMEHDATVIISLATFVLQKILACPAGLAHCSATPERITNVLHVLNIVVTHLTVHPSTRLLKLAIRCYISLSRNRQIFDLVKHTLPQSLKDNTFMAVFGSSRTVTCEWHCLLQMLGFEKDPAKIDFGDGLLTKEILEAVFSDTGSSDA
ncbi:hypothetical protein QR680_018512 [Steinernema hermaphroditum]|uniref:CCR4-NOT transcription complex subunit 9 n=1 Tax=Steinernema hermaphroditum TaxID=289476 RepID=A0AA39HJF1_9BILA|nr:hypothetical protein QR680_018512 [Steinernema hermaphroditum]